jgi:hypothetical protein
MPGSSGFTKTQRILIVEDEVILAKDLARSLKNLGYEVLGRLSSAEEAIRMVEDSQPDLILMDVKLDRDEDGIEAAEKIRIRYDIPVVYLTGFSEKDVLDRAKKTEPYGYLGKPVGLMELRSTLETALYRHEADKKTRESEARFRSIFELSPDANVIYDFDGYIDCNESCVRMLGLKSREDLLSGQPTDISPEFQPDGRSSLEKARAMMEIAFSEGSHRFEWVCQKPDGAPVYLDIVANRIMLRDKAVIHAMGRDIGERKKTEETLKESEERYRNIVETANEGIWIIDVDGTTTFANKQMAEMLGTTTAEMKGRSFYEYIDEDEISQARHNFNKRSKGIAEHHEFRFRRRDGSEIWTNVSTVPTYDSQGRFSGALAMISDITLRKRAEDALMKKQRLLEEAEKLACVGAWEWDLATDRFYMSDEWRRIHGCEDPNPSRESLLPIAHPDDREAVEHAFNEVIEKGVPYEITHRIIRQDDGQERVVRAHGYVVRDDSGKPSRMYGAAQDITEGKKSEEALAKSQAQLNAIFDSISDPIVFADTNRRIVRVNRAFEKVLGYSEDEVVGRTTEFLYRDKESYEEQGRKRFHQNIETERPIFEAEYRRKDGTLFLAESLGLQVRDSKQELIGLLGVHRDITDRKKAEERLKRSAEFLNATGRMAKVGGWELDAETKEVRWTEQTYHIHEIPLDHSPPLEEALSFFHPEDRPKLEKAIERAIEHGEPYDMELRFQTAMGNKLWTHTMCRPVVKDGRTIKLVGTFQDITEQKRSEDQIKASLAEKEVLLREIHHRVKNNLALINSLLSLRAEYPSDKSAQEMFDEVRTRIRSMAVAHEILYQSDNLAHLSVRDYIENLLNHILYSHVSVGTSIFVEKDIEEVSFGLSTAIPLGFLITELLSNCLKHAFPDGRQGKVWLSLGSVNEHEFELSVADDGVGIPESVDLKNPRSMGMDLIDTFVQQLHGWIEVKRKEGTEVRIRFREIGHKAAR